MTPSEMMISYLGRQLEKQLIEYGTQKDDSQSSDFKVTTEGMKISFYVKPKSQKKYYTLIGYYSFDRDGFVMPYDSVIDLDATWEIKTVIDSMNFQLRQLESMSEEQDKVNKQLMEFVD